MNNLELIQEARLGLAPLSDDALALDFGALLCVVYKTTSGWYVAIAGDELHYHFATMGEACDFACGEARMAMH